MIRTSMIRTSMIRTSMITTFLYQNLSNNFDFGSQRDVFLNFRSILNW